MRLNNYYKLKHIFETHSFESNFKSLSTVLYYFSFLGNIFLILFSYFFVKDITDTIPNFFPRQDLFFSIFIALFMTGYELFKRFSFEQLTVALLKVRKVTKNAVVGILVCLALVIGSFYLSLNGAHRLVDTKELTELKLDTTQSKVADSIRSVYQIKITPYQEQVTKLLTAVNSVGTLSSRQEAARVRAETKIKGLETERELLIDKNSTATEKKAQSQRITINQNSAAFAIIVFFLEFIILIGVGFNAYYKWSAFNEMKILLATAQYRQLELNLQLLKLYYQNGRRKDGDTTMSKSRFKALVRASKADIKLKDIDSFLALCAELEIIRGFRIRHINVTYEKAQEMVATREIL